MADKIVPALAASVDSAAGPHDFRAPLQVVMTATQSSLASQLPVVVKAGTEVSEDASGDDVDMSDDSTSSTSSSKAGDAVKADADHHPLSAQEWRGWFETVQLALRYKATAEADRAMEPIDFAFREWDWSLQAAEAHEFLGRIRHEAEWVNLYNCFEAEQAEYRADKARNWDALLEDPVQLRDLFHSLAAEKANEAPAESLNELLERKQCLTIEQLPGGLVCLAQYLTGIVNAAAGGFFVFIVSACLPAFWKKFVSHVLPFFQAGGRGIVILPGWRIDSEDYSLLCSLERVFSDLLDKDEDSRAYLRFVYADDESSTAYPYDDKLITVSPGGDLVQAILDSDPVDDHGMPALKLSGAVCPEAITTSENLSIVRSRPGDNWTRELMCAVASYLAEIGRDGVYCYATPTLSQHVSSVGHAQSTVDPEPGHFGPRRPQRA